MACNRPTGPTDCTAKSDCLYDTHSYFFSLFSNLRSVDLSTTTDSKQFQELLLEHTKAFAQSQSEKSSNADGELKILLIHSLFFFLSLFLFFFNYFKCISQSPIVLISIALYFIISLNEKSIHKFYVFGCLLMKSLLAKKN